jgi:hypothetical protein
VIFLLDAKHEQAPIGNPRPYPQPLGRGIIASLNLTGMRRVDQHSDSRGIGFKTADAIAMKPGRSARTGSP